MAGLIVALHQAGVFSVAREKPPQVRNDSAKPAKAAENPVVTGTYPGTTQPSPTDETRSYPVTQSFATEIRVEQAVYKILSTRLERHAPGKLSLKFQVRMTNNGRYDTNFWAASFRLLVNGVPQAPVSDLNELVASHSAKRGVGEFVIPESTTDVGLQVGEVGDGAPTTHIPFKAARPQSKGAP